MIESPWNLILTVIFIVIVLICVGDFIARRIGRVSRVDARGNELADHDLIDLNHTVMSVAMILMIWVVVLDVFTWAQLALFAIFIVALILSFGRSRGWLHRIDLVGHIVMNAAMIWMLAAMPLLMAEMHAGGGEHSTHVDHHGEGVEMGATATPQWADLVNVLFIVTCAAWVLWWLYRALVVRGHRIHALCHALMAGGMGVMLGLMNT